MTAGSAFEPRRIELACYLGTVTRACFTLAGPGRAITWGLATYLTRTTELRTTKAGIDASVAERVPDPSPSGNSKEDRGLIRAPRFSDLPVGVVGVAVTNSLLIDEVSR